MAARGSSPATISCEGEGGLAVLRSDFVGLEGVDGVKIYSCNQDDERRHATLPSWEDATIAIGNAPGKVYDPYKDEIDEIQIALITPDSFKSDFTMIDVPVGALCNMLLSPFSATDGVEITTKHTDLKRPVPDCRYQSEVLAVKMLKGLSRQTSEAIAEDFTVSNNDASIISERLQEGSWLAFVLRGAPGFSSALKQKIGPEIFEGGSLAARTFNSNCIKAIFAGEDNEPAVVRGVSRAATYRTICHLFSAAELGVGKVSDLFPEDLPNEIVTIRVRQDRFFRVLKRLERGGFNVIGLRIMKGREIFLALRRFNGITKWDEIMTGKFSAGASALDGIEVTCAVDGMNAIYGKGNWDMGQACDDKKKGVGFRQEGIIDGFDSKELLKTSASLNETVCLVVPHSALKKNGLSSVIDSVQRNASGFGIVAARFVAFTVETAGRFCLNRERPKCL